ncbi:MAG: hypothetical protein AAB434_11950, partial [Planctomycetota bacterium]
MRTSKLAWPVAPVLVALALAAAPATPEEGNPMPAIEEIAVTPEGAKATHLSLSRDGNLVAYRRVGSMEKGLWIFDRKTGEHRPLVADSEEKAYFAPTFSPDGKAIAFLVGEPVVPPSYTSVGVLTIADRTRLDFPGSAFSWSPTSKRIAIANRESGELGVGSLKTGKVTEIAPIAPGWDPLEPPAMAWSPDGESIAYAVTLPEQGSQGIRCALVDKKELTRVFDYQAKRASIYLFWSPDGRLGWHAVLPGDKPTSEICALDASGKPETLYHSDLVDAAGRPAWSP